MSSSNEPGKTDPGTEAPHWQRSARPPAGAAAQSPPAGVDARVSRYITGKAAPEQLTARVEKPAEHTEVVRPVVNPVELPDLSGMGQAPAQRDPVRDRPADPSPGNASPGMSNPGMPSPGKSSPRVRVAARPAGPVRASLQVRHIDPWSALKVSSLLSVALFFVWMIAVAFLYLVLGGMGVWSKLNSNVGDLLTSTSGGGGELVSSGTIFGGAALIGLVNIVLLTAMATIGAFIYNLSTDIVGGIEVTLADRD